MNRQLNLIILHYNSIRYTFVTLQSDFKYFQFLLDITVIRISIRLCRVKLILCSYTTADWLVCRALDIFTEERIPLTHSHVSCFYYAYRRHYYVIFPYYLLTLIIQSLPT